jgi:hypothetical protein
LHPALPRGFFYLRQNQEGIRLIAGDSFVLAFNRQHFWFVLRPYQIVPVNATSNVVQNW